MNVMRIGEFAWSRMEPEEGHYDFDWLHRVVDKLGAAGIRDDHVHADLHPAGLADRELSRRSSSCDDDGVPTLPRRARHVCPNSPVYRDHCARIVDADGRGVRPDDRTSSAGRSTTRSIPLTGRGCCCPVCRRQVPGACARVRHHRGAERRLGHRPLEPDLPVVRPDARSRTRDTWHHPSLLSRVGAVHSDSYVDVREAPGRHPAPPDEASGRHGHDADSWASDYGDMNKRSSTWSSSTTTTRWTTCGRRRSGSTSAGRSRAVRSGTPRPNLLERRRSTANGYRSRASAGPTRGCRSRSAARPTSTGSGARTGAARS